MLRFDMGKLPIAFATLLSLIMVPSATDEHVPGADAAGSALSAPMLDDFEIVAEALGVSMRDVQFVDELLEAHRDLQVELREKYPESFGGMYVDYSPAQIVILWEGPVGSELDDILGTDGVVVRETLFSEIEIEDHQLAVNETLNEAGIRSDSWTDIRTGSVNVEVLDGDSHQAAHDLRSASLNDPDDPAVNLRTVEELSHQQATITGGMRTTSCTSGFNVRRPSDGARRATVAGHCGNTQSFGSTSSSYFNQWWGGSRDVQMHTFSSSHTLTAQFQVGSGLRSVTSSRSRTATVIGETVCHYGPRSGHDCGTISSKTHTPASNVVPSAYPTFIQVAPLSGAGALTTGGDSGGPWFIGNRAYGFHTGAATNGSYSYYMSVSFIPSPWVLMLS